MGLGLDCFTRTFPASISDGSAQKGGNCEFGVFKGGATFGTAWQNRSAVRVGPHNYNVGEGSTIRHLRDVD